MNIDKCSVALFMRCAYSKEIEIKEAAIIEVGGEECWNLLYTTYVDLSGAADSKEHNLMRALFNIECRLQFINEMLDLQVKCFNEFGQPFLPATLALKPYGHKIAFNGNAEDFKAQLQRVEMREAKKIAEKDSIIKELNQLRKEGMKASNITTDDRVSFIRLLNSISKHQGYGIDKEKTMADEFALMVKSHKEHFEALTEKQ